MALKLASEAKGLSEIDFRERFGSEEQCRTAIAEMRWRDGFCCPSCEHKGHAYLKKRGHWQCNRCKHQVSVTAGTIFHSTKLPLTIWFLAMYHLSQSKGGISSVELGRRLGVRQGTAWSLKQKLMQAMLLREETKPKLDGRVEIDDAYLGGVRGGKRGRGAAGKTPFVAAVETTAENRPKRLRLKVVKGFRKREISKLAKAEIAAGTKVESDGLRCWTAVTEAGCEHSSIKTGSGKKAATLAPFKWVNTTLGNIKTALAGTYHHVSPKHAQRYLTSFAWRFNRRYALDTMIERLAWACTHNPPFPYRAIVIG
jgi:ribosomal protein L37AE/L43A/transposase-like protein